MAIKNVTLTVNFFAYDTAALTGKTGDVANINMFIIKDGGIPTAATNAETEPSATNMPGVYELVLTAAEMNADFITIAGKSSTADIVVSPLFISTEQGTIAVIDAIVNSIIIDTAEIGIAGVGLTDLGGMSTAMKAEVVDGVWDEVIDGGVHDTVDTAGHRVRQLHDLLFMTENVAQAGSTSTTLVLAAGDSSVDDIYNGNVVHIFAGTGTNQTAVITDYDGTTKIATITPSWQTTPANGDSYSISIGMVSTQTGGLTAAQVNAEVDTALADINLDHFMKVAVTGGDVIDNSALAVLVSKSVTADFDDYNNLTDSLQAIADKTLASSGGAPVDSGNAQAGSSTSLTLRAAAPSVSLVGNMLVLVNGTGDNQVREILTYDTTTKIATVIAWDVTPDGTTDYEVRAALAVDLTVSGGGLGPGADNVTLTFLDSVSSNPTTDADVWIATDAAMTNVIAGTLQTNGAGSATFRLDAGVSYFYAIQKDGIMDDFGVAFTAVAD